MLKKLGTILLMLLSLTSCEYTSIYLLTEADLEWLAPYHDNDVVLFSASDGSVDTMVVTHELHNTPGVGINCFSTFYAEGNYTNTIHHQGSSFECKLIMVKESQNDVRMRIRFNRRFLADELQVGDTTKVVVKGHVYHDALMIDDGNSHISPDDRVVGINCEYFIWSKSKGLLEYKYQDGEVYTLYKRVTFGEKEWWGAFPFWRQLKWYLSEL